MAVEKNLSKADKGLGAADTCRARPQVTAYEDYRRFLQDFYNYKKSQKTSFSYRLFAQRAGFKSPNYLQLVMQGKRNLSVAGAAGVAKAVGLSSIEKKYFECLVQLANAQGNDEQRSAQRDLLSAKTKFIGVALPSVHRQVLSQSYHLLVRELAALPNFRGDADWISKKLSGLITPTQAQKSLDLLVAGGYLSQDKKGKWSMAEPSLDLGHAFDESLVLKTHLDTLNMWTRLLPELNKDQRELGLINIPMRADKIPEFKNRVREFQDEIISWLENEESPDSVVQLGTYIVPLTSDDH